MHGVRRCLERRDGAVRIVIIALLELAQHVGIGLLNALFLQLAVAALRAALRRGGQEDLQPGVWQHDRADVAPVHDDAVRAGKAALHVQQKCAHDRQRRHARGEDRHLRQADGLRDVLAVEEHPLLPCCVIDQFDLQPRQQRLHGSSVRAVDTGPLAGKADRAVDRAGVHIDEAEAARGRTGDRALAGAGRAVDGNGDVCIQNVRFLSCVMCRPHCRPHSRCSRRSAG